MKLGQQFTNQWHSHVSLQLACFDRVSLTGYLPFWSPGCVNRWICGGLGILHKDFIPQMKCLSDQLVDFAKQQAVQAGAPFHYLQGRCRKEALINQISRERHDPEGLVAVLCTQESCRTVKLTSANSIPCCPIPG